jgi:endonuclease/exonuclease/phosphatase (EEP) superfamily protein YafD
MPGLERKHLKQSRVLILSLLIYTSCIILWIIFRDLTGDISLFIILLNYLGVWLFFPILIFIPWGLFSRNRTFRVLIILPVSIFLWFYASAFFLKGSGESHPEFFLRVVTLNLHIENQPDEDFILNLERLSPDLYAFQEVSSYSEAILTQNLSDRYPYHQYNGSEGLAIYSRYPIGDGISPSGGDSPFQSVTILVDGNSIHLVNSHLAQTRLLEFMATGNADFIREAVALRSAQIDEILDVVGQLSLPTILACDCNMTPLTQTYSQITDVLQDAYLMKGWGLGHTLLIPRSFEIPSTINLPFQRIDYIFVSFEFNILSAALQYEDMGSDHRPLMAELNFTP